MVCIRPSSSCNRGNGADRPGHRRRQTRRGRATNCEILGPAWRTAYSNFHDAQSNSIATTDASESDAGYGQLAGSIIYSSARRAKASVLIRNRRGQSDFGAMAFQGTANVLSASGTTLAELVRQAVQAHAYWRMKDSQSIWSSGTKTTRFRRPSGHDHGPVTSQPRATLVDKPGGIFVRAASRCRKKIGAHANRGVILVDNAGTLYGQINVGAHGTLDSSSQTGARRLSLPRPKCQGAICPSSTVWAGSAATGANMSCFSDPTGPLPRPG